ncbi:LysE family translocator [Vibrio salinus]|uniref:LysE family translocator n=1 Tax=Vibrio salinus TaxID=2899784 RepID=UPI001E38A591|nr:LysE family transporter [Vibrio salinus]MCE0496006.1 LysE family transporter [Vibrio salinus]
MLAIFAYAIGIMYTPGPVNLLGLYSGINGRTRNHLGFFAGIGFAMFILFVFLGFAGNQVMKPTYLPFISLVGCLYILYIAWKVLKANVHLNNVDTDTSNSHRDELSFKDGVIMQLLNPKGLVATLPIATIQFPSIGIAGGELLFWSFILAVLAFGAPASYSLMGLVVGKRIESQNYFRIFNYIMSVLLVYVSFSIGYQYVYIPLLN